MRAAILARVSSATQVREGTGLTTQLDKGRAEVSQRGWTLTGEFVSEGVSGLRLDRPDIEQLREAIAQGAIDVVVVPDWDRLGRSEAVVATVREELHDAGIPLVVNGQLFDATDEGALVGGVMGAVAAYDRRKIVRRMAEGQHQRAKAGGWPGGVPPYGFQLVYEAPANGGRPLPSAVQHPGEVQVIRAAYELIAVQGRSTWQAAADLNARGLTPRTQPPLDPQQPQAGAHAAVAGGGAGMG
jgi:site-specific DNA recombinase